LIQGEVIYNKEKGKRKDKRIQEEEEKDIQRPTQRKGGKIKMRGASSLFSPSPSPAAGPKQQQRCVAKEVTQDPQSSEMSRSCRSCADNLRFQCFVHM